MEALGLKKNKVTYVLFFAALIILILSSITMLKELGTHNMASQWVTHTDTVITKIDRLFLNFLKAEKQFQRYRDAPNDRNKALYSAAILEMENSLLAVKELTKDNIHQQARVNDVLSMVVKIISSSNLNKNEGIFYNMRTIINKINTEELLLLKQRLQEFEYEKHLTYIKIIVSIIVGYLFLLLFCWAIIKLAKQNAEHHLMKQQLEQEKLLLYEAQRLELEVSLNTAKQGFWNLNLKTGIIERSLLHDRIFGYSSRLPKWTYKKFLAHVHPDDRERVTYLVKNSIKNNLCWELECRIYRADNKSLRWILATGKILQLGESKHMLGLVQDITERKQMESLLTESEKVWKFALENAQHGVWDWRVPEKVVYYSHSWKAMLGYEDNEIKNEQQEFENRVHPDDMGKVWKCVNDHFEQKTSEYLCEVRFRCKDGRYKWILDRGKVVSRAPDGTVLRAIGTHTDISELKEIESNLKHLAEHDTLTGLVNRTLFEDRLDQAILLAKRKKTMVAVFFIDIDGFKQVNDIYGHGVGDIVLRTVATRLQSNLRSMDTCARFGGDEFVLFLQDIKKEQDVITMAKKMMHYFAKKIVINEKQLKINLSIGISLYPKDGDQQLIEKADKAMYYVKKHEKNNIKLFDESLTSLETKPRTWFFDKK